MGDDEFGDFDNYGDYGDRDDDEVYVDDGGDGSISEYGDESIQFESEEGGFKSASDEIDYGMNFKDLERVGMGGDGVIGGKLGKIQKAIRDPREKAIAQLQGILFEGELSFFKEQEKKDAVHLAKKIDINIIPLLNGEILAATLIYMSLYGESSKDLNEKNLSKFMNRLKSTSILVTDIIRYFTYVKSKMT